MFVKILHGRRILHTCPWALSWACRWKDVFSLAVSCSPARADCLKNKLGDFCPCVVTVTVLEEALRGHPVYHPSLRDEQLFPQYLTDTLSLIFTANYEPGDYVVTTVFAVGTVLAAQMHGTVEKRSSFLLLTCGSLEDQRNPEEKGIKKPIYTSKLSGFWTQRCFLWFEFLLIRIILCNSDHESNAWHFLAKWLKFLHEFFAVCSAFKHNWLRSTHLQLFAVNCWDYSRGVQNTRKKTHLLSFQLLLMQNSITTVCVMDPSRRLCHSHQCKVGANQEVFWIVQGPDYVKEKIMKKCARQDGKWLKKCPLQRQKA